MARILQQKDNQEKIDQEGRNKELNKFICLLMNRQEFMISRQESRAADDLVTVTMISYQKTENLPEVNTFGRSFGCPL
jgi:hypothetical protein